MEESMREAEAAGVTIPESPTLTIQPTTSEPEQPQKEDRWTTKKPFSIKQKIYSNISKIKQSINKK